MKFSALNVDTRCLRLDPVGSRRPAHASVKEGTLLQSAREFEISRKFVVKIICERHAWMEWKNINDKQ